MPKYWKIVGGADKGGILVREGKELGSPATSEKLSTGTKVVEIELADGRLSFEKVAGTGGGRASGWISLKVGGKPLAEGPFDSPDCGEAPEAPEAPKAAVAVAEPVAVEPQETGGGGGGTARFWIVIGGEDKGGILVREGCALTSPAAADRLATGAQVEELELQGERLRFRRRAGGGPAEGWVSLRLQSKALLEGPFSEEQLQSRPSGGPAEAAPAEANGREAAWIDQSRAKMQAFHEGTKVLPPAVDPASIPVRLRHGDPRQALPPFKRLSAKQMGEESKKNLPGHWTGMKFPHNSDQLKSFGPEWYTEAFHKGAVLSPDNRVTKIVKVEQLPHSGFDAAGGAGHKAFLTLQYAKHEPGLHTELFAKFPWYFDESESARKYRMQLSTRGDVDSQELLASVCCEHLFPFRIPKLYFADINRDTTNYMLITERIPFSKRGKVVNGKVVERISRKPYEIWPVCGKYQDYLLEDPAKIYFCLFREMAHLAAWDQTGRFDSFFGEMTKYTEEAHLEHFKKGKKPGKQKMLDLNRKATRTLLDSGVDFATSVARQVFTEAGRDPKMLKQMVEDVVFLSPHAKDDVIAYTSNSSEWTSAMHMNLQADNAYFWADERGELDCGVFDWCGFNRAPFVMNFMGCLSGASADFMDAHEEGLMKMFCDEYERYGGPSLDWREMLLRCHLQWPSFMVDCCRWIEEDIYLECKKEEWPSIRTILDDKFVSRWTVRCRTTTLINAFDFWPRRPFRKIFEEWMAGKGKQYLTQYTA